jgi:hypothetical protein
MDMSAKLTDLREIIPIIFGGKSVFTLRSTTTGNEYTYMVEEADKRNPNDPKEIPVYFVKLLTGPDNLRNYTYMGTIFDRKVFRLTKKSRVTMQTPSVIAFDWTFRCYISGKVPETAEFYPSKRCARCCHPLTVTDSVITGFGPECADRVGVIYAHVRGTVTATKQDAPARGSLLNSFKTRLAPKQTQNFQFDALDNKKEAAADVDEQEAARLETGKQAVAEGIFTQKQLDMIDADASLAQVLKAEYDDKTPAHQVPNDVIESAIQNYKTNSPDAYYQNGILNEEEAHAVAHLKFQHELA